MRRLWAYFFFFTLIIVEPGATTRPRGIGLRADTHILACRFKSGLFIAPFLRGLKKLIIYGLLPVDGLLDLQSELSCCASEGDHQLSALK